MVPFLTLRSTLSRLKCEVFTAMKLSIIVFWLLTLCGLVSGDPRVEAACSSKRLVPTWKCTRCHNPEDHRWQFVGYRELNLSGTKEVLSVRFATRSMTLIKVPVKALLSTVPRRIMIDVEADLHVKAGRW